MVTVIGTVATTPASAPAATRRGSAPGSTCVIAISDLPRAQPRASSPPHGQVLCQPGAPVGSESGTTFASFVPAGDTASVYSKCREDQTCRIWQAWRLLALRQSSVWGRATGRRYRAPGAG